MKRLQYRHNLEDVHLAVFRASGRWEEIGEQHALRHSIHNHTSDNPLASSFVVLTARLCLIAYEPCSDHRVPHWVTRSDSVNDLNMEAGGCRNS
jgi:hypothetical protein